MKRRASLWLLTAALKVAWAGQSGQPALEVIPLAHRLAEEVIPVLEPLLAPGGTLTGMGDRLVVKTTPENLQELKAVLAGIDRAPRRLRIYLRQDVGGSLEAGGQALSAEARAEEGYDLHYEALSTRAREDRFDTHFVETLEGQPAWIATGEAVPLPTQSVVVGRGGAVLQEGIEYHELASGFYVVPRLSGERVTLEIRPQLERLRPEGGALIETQQASTTLTGALGQWIPLGGAREGFARREGTALAATRAQGAQSRGLWVKVEEVR